MTVRPQPGYGYLLRARVLNARYGYAQSEADLTEDEEIV